MAADYRDQRRAAGKRTEGLLAAWAALLMLALCIVGAFTGYPFLSAVVAMPVALLLVVGIRRWRRHG